MCVVSLSQCHTLVQNRIDHDREISPAHHSGLIMNVIYKAYSHTQRPPGMRNINVTALLIITFRPWLKSSKQGQYMQRCFNDPELLESKICFSLNMPDKYA